MGRFETNWLARPENLATLTDLSARWIELVSKHRSRKRVVLDMDSSVSPTHGDQESSVWNGHFGCTCYHPLFVFNQFGDLERCALRAGNVHSADGWETVLKPVVARYKGTVEGIALRADAAVGQPNMYEFLEVQGIEYAIRLPANKSFRYKAASWSRPRRVVAKVEWHLGELFPRVGFIITNLHYSSKNIVEFYNKRGTAEQWVKEWKVALKGTRLSCRSFNANAVRLQLHALAYNLGNFLRTLATPEAIAEWMLTSLREKLIKIGANPTEVVRCDNAEDCCTTIAPDGNVHMSNPVAIHVGQTSGEARPYEYVVGFWDGQRPKSWSLSCRSNQAA